MTGLNRLYITILLILVVATSAWAQSDPGAATGPAPAADFDLAEFQGQVVLVDFWASWCAPCRESLPWLNSISAKYRAQGLQVVMVNLDKKAGAAAKMAAQIAPGIRQLLDPEGKLAAKYKLEGMPSSYLYDRDGQLISSHIGFLKADGKKREQAVTAALAKDDF